MQITTGRLSLQHGVTLLELLIVIAIISIIAAAGYPSYTQYVVNTKRTAATTMLVRIADRQQQFFMDNKRYAGALTNLGFAADPLYVADDGATTAAVAADSVYVMSLANVANTTYTALAAPLGAQLERDTKCGTLTLNQAGTRDALGGGDDCW